MSNFYIQQKALSGNQRTLVKNQQGQAIFLLVGRWGTRGDALSLYKMNGDLVASLKQTSFAIGSKFDLYQGFEKVGSLQRFLTLNRDFYFIHGLNWVVVGDIKNQHYKIHQLNHSIMVMDKVFLATGDFYQLSVTDDQHAPLCICISAILDYWVHTRRPDKQPQFIPNWGLD